MRKHCPILADATACMGHIWVLLRDPLAGPRGIVLGVFDPLYVKLCVGTLGTKFHPQTTPQKITTKHYDTLV